jgi:hypothetical protein
VSRGEGSREGADSPLLSDTPRYIKVSEVVIGPAPLTDRYINKLFLLCTIDKAIAKGL